MLCFRPFSGPILVLTLLISTPAWADIIVNSFLDCGSDGCVMTPSSSLRPASIATAWRQESRATLPISPK
jgi:hypothetical protein